MNSLPQRRSLVSETADVLRQEINAGTWPDFLPGERELSARLLVSRPTLRAALELLQREGKIDVTHGVRRRVRQRVKTPKPAVTNRIVLLTPLPHHRMPPCVMFWVDELRQHLVDEGFDLDIQVSPLAHVQRPEKHLERLHKDIPAAVWILFLSSEPMQRWFSERRIPCVIAGSRFSGVGLPSVDIDSHAVCRHAAGLFAARKHKHIALLLPDSRTAGDQASEAGFLEGVGSDKTIRATVFRHNGSIENVCQKVESIATADAPVTALLIARSAHVLTALTALQQRGTRIPQDLSLISRDNDAFLDFVVPRIARYACNPATFARRVSRVVFQLKSEGPVSARQILLMPEFVKGETLRAA